METRTALALSGTAHGGLIVWALIGGLFNPVDDDEKLQVAQISVVSASEFDALVSNAPATAEPPRPPAPVPPEPSTATPAPSAETAPAPPPPPDAPDVTPPDAAPDTAQIVQPPLTDVAPETPDAPSSPAEAPDAPVTDTPAPRRADVISTTPTPAPPPLVETAPTIEAPAAPTEVVQDDPVEPAETEAAPEETAPIIVTEDQTPSAAPERSIRPGRRPARPEPVVASAPSETPAEPTPPRAAEAEPEAPVDPLAAAIGDALAEANATPAPAPAAPSGPPLTQGEREGLRVSVSRCWNLGSLSTEALRTRVTIFMEMTRDGKPRTDTIRLVAFDGGSEAAANQAYEAGRRAIIRCATDGRDGYELPPGKFEQWKEIEMTFNPEQMRGR